MQYSTSKPQNYFQNLEKKSPPLQILGDERPRVRAKSENFGHIFTPLGAILNPSAKEFSMSR